MKKLVFIILSCALLFSCNLEDKKMSFTYPLMSPSSVYYPSYDVYQKDDNGNLIELSNYYAFNQCEMVSYNYLMDSHKDELDKKLKEAIKKIIYLSMCFDQYTFFKKEDGSFLHNVAYLNDHYGDNEFIKLEEETYDLLKIAYDLSIKTKGKFNFAIGKLSTLWDESIKSRVVPSKENIQNALNNTPTVIEIKDMFIFDDTNKSVQFKRIEGKDISLTFGGIAKGRTTDLLKDILNGEHTMVSLGQSSLASYNDSFSNSWNLSISNPLYPIGINTKENIHFAYQGAFSFSTSGDYQNYFINDNIRYHHIIDPSTGYPSSIDPSTLEIKAPHHRSVSVFYDGENSGAVVDALTTALMCMSKEEGQEILSKMSNCYPIYIDEENGNMKGYVKEELKEYVSLEEGASISLSFF